MKNIWKKKQKKKNILSLKYETNSERNLRNQLTFYDARKACHMSDTGTSQCISFFFSTTPPPLLRYNFGSVY